MEPFFLHFSDFLTIFTKYMSAKNVSQSIFDYFDYREFLSDRYAHLKSKRPSYSYRTFSKESGISSHNFLPRILKRERNLTEEFVPLLSAFLNLSEKEANYFKQLVDFNNAKRPSIKEKLLKQLLALRYATQEYRIEDKKLNFFGKWYYPVIRELVTICDFREDYARLARQCIPRITAAQARGAVAYLLENGFIKRSPAGVYEVADPVIATAPEVDSAIIPAYHKITLRQCADAVETMSRHDRNFTSSTLLVSKEVYEEFKKEIHLFRKRLLAMAKECKNPNMVCFAGFQLLPRSERIMNPRANSGSKGGSR